MKATIPPSQIKRFLLAAGIALAVPLTAAAYGGHGHHGHGFSGHHGYAGCGMNGDLMGMHLPMHLGALNLTEAQRDKMFTIMHNQAPQLRDKAKALRKAEEDLRAAAIAPDGNEARLQTLADASAKAGGELALARARVERQVVDVLTPEQRRELAEFKPGEGRSGMGGRGMPRRDMRDMR